MSRYWHHPDSDCVFVTPDDPKPMDPACEEIDHPTFEYLKEKYAAMPCAYCGDTGYFYTDPDLGYCNCEHGVAKVFDDNKDIF